MIDSAQGDIWLDQIQPGARVRYIPPMQNPACPSIEDGTVRSVGSRRLVAFVHFDDTNKVEPTSLGTLMRIDD